MSTPDEEKVTEAKILFSKVKYLSKKGLSQRQIAENLGIKTTLTLSNRLVRASQITGDAVPPFRKARSSLQTDAQAIETVEVNRRGRGSAYGVSIPQEPLQRAGIQLGDVLRLRVRGKSILLIKQ